jgi:Uma2 family endonuclease
VPAPVAKPLRPATLDDLLALPEGGRHRELIEGTLVEKGGASGKHGQVQCKLSAYVDPFHRRAGGRGPGGWWFAADVHVFFDDANTLQPDVAGWRRERLAGPPGEAVVRARPDWTCEILSTNRRNDLVKKKRVYHRHQVPHYWIIDPAEETLLVYRWAAEGYVDVLSAERGERIRAEPFDAIELVVAELFGDADEEPEAAP